MPAEAGLPLWGQGRVVDKCACSGRSELACELPDNCLKFLPEDIRIDGGRCQDRTFHLDGGGDGFLAPFREGDYVAAAVRGAPDPGDMAVGLQPAQGLAHSLGLDPHVLGQLRLSHRALHVEDFDGNNAGVGETDSAEFFIPGVFNQARSSGQEAPCGPLIHIRHSSKYSQVSISTAPGCLLGWCVPPATRRKTLADRLVTGDDAPQFTLKDSSGKDVSLAPRSGRHTIVYFYPAASTPGCTKEACDFRDSLASLQSAGYDVLGISPDPVKKLATFAANETLTFPLLADEDHAVADAYGAWGEKKNYGKTYEGLIRSTIVVDSDGKVALAQYNVRATGHVAKLRRDLKLDA
jgi:peroxiredoxin Q/BCP